MRGPRGTPALTAGAPASPPQARGPHGSHSPGHTEGRCYPFPVCAVAAGRALRVSCHLAPGTPLRAGLLPSSVHREGSDSDQSVPLGAFPGQWPLCQH